MQKNILIILWLTIVGTATAWAGAIVQIQNYSAVGVGPTLIGITPNLFLGFDASLGNLDAVSLRVNGRIGSTPACFNTAFWQEGAGGPLTFPCLVAVTQNIALTNSSFSATIVTAGTPGAPDNYISNNTLQSYAYTLNGVDSTLFHEEFYLTIHDQLIQRGSPVLFYAKDLGSIRVTYNYTPFSAVGELPESTVSIPEPDTLALFGLGVLALVAFGMKRRRRRSVFSAR